MNLKTILISFVLLSNFLMNLSVAGTDDTIKFGKTADWIINREVSLPETLPLDNIESGVYFALVDNQVRAIDRDQPVFYSHYAELVVNQQGLEEATQISVLYDPTYEKLVFNSLNIHRNGKIINKQDTAKITIIQREARLEDRLYDGRLTANVILDDVRVGDIVEYSYTLKGTNPVYKGLFAYDRHFEWSVPIHKQRIRVLWGKAKPLFVTTLNSEVNVKKRPQGRFTEYTVSINDSDPFYINSEVPDWYNPYGVIYFSESKSWSEIALWALPLYERAVETVLEIQVVADAIRTKYKKPETQIVEALKYVQSEIRYLGIEMGSNSHTPSAAHETLQRRYGDCKDKAVLFISLLKVLGIEASPVLVNTDINKQVVELPPLVNAFDHVIVKVKYDNDVFWLDPTRKYQKGRLKDIYQPDYGYALVIDRGTSSLERMNDKLNQSKIVVNDRFDLSKGGNKDVVYETNTEYYGYRAEKQRYALDKDGVTGLQKKYIEFYNGYYTDVEPLMKFKITEDKVSGSILQKEKYLIKNFWETNNEDKEYSGNFYANSITSYLAKPEQVIRNSPYKMSHPVNIKQTIDVMFGEDGWQFDDEEFVEENPFFFFKSSVSYDKASRTLNLGYDYKSRTDHVLVAQLDEYMAARDRVRDKIEYGIVEYFKTDSQPIVDEEDYTSSIFGVIISVYVIGLMFLIINWRMDARKQPEFHDVSFYPVSLVKLFILTFASFGLYTIYWFYRNWLYQKTKNKNSIMPTARAIFNPFWYYPLYKALLKDSVERFQENRVLIKPLAILFAILYLLVNAFSDKDYFTIPFLVLIPLLLMPLVNYINHINENERSAYKYNSRWLARHTLLVVLVLPLFVLTAGTEVNLFPSSKVVSGDRILGHDIKFMHRKGVFPADEKIIYFYSDALLEIRDDGNGFTDNHVFSYWKDEEKFNVSKASFTNIKDIDVTYAKKSTENTVVNIVKEDGDDFVLYVSREDGLDKNFVEELRNRWHKSKSKN